MPNNSFETVSSCNINPGEIFKAPPWIDPTNATSDCYNECSTNVSTSVPLNQAGHLFARTGKGYAGFVTYTNGVLNHREYIQVKLTDSLIRDSVYCVRYYVSRGSNAQYAANGFSAYFSTTPVSCPVCFLPFSPQINYNGTIVVDSIDWTEISGHFVASGGEKYLTIGNFNDDSHTNVLLVSPANSNIVSYYYIDDVYVGTCDTIKPPVIVSSLSVPNVFTPNSDGVNDVFKIQGSNIRTLTCSIYDRWGGKVWELKNRLENWDGRNPTGMPCNDGVYFYVLDAAGEDGKTYHQTGFVELVR